MTTRAEAKAEVTSWNEEGYTEIEGGGKLTKASVTQKVTGDLEGESSWESLMCHRPDGTATFVGMERVVGRIGEREGSYVVQVSGDYDGTTARSTGSVVEGAGTGGLSGLRGTVTGTATATEVTISLEYDLE
jgi:hypothetical protein